MSKKKSIVWNYFVEDTDRLICQVLVNKRKCGASIKKNGNTSAMLNHLRSIHPHVETETIHFFYLIVTNINVKL